ncbi:MAG TPA: hypothetical protein VM427_10030 [Patescibacteria group bacterium]|nr:hypothetical protein [Patescibacteria group bacterium]
MKPTLALLLVGALAGCGGLDGSAPQSSGDGGSPTPGAPATASAPAGVGSPDPLPDPSPDPSPSSTASAAPTRASRETPTRLVVARLGIDLPIVSGDLRLPGNPPDYPLCGVAQYLTIYRDPSRLGTSTWIYGHARPRMLLPLLEASTVKNGAALVGMKVDLYSDAAQRYTYRITTVLRHATDRTAATDVPADGRRLILQTSEGPAGTVPKLQVVAEFVSEVRVEPGKAMPTASPIGCYLGP